MVLRHYKGKRPQITFTSDFHELVAGDLVPGPCVLLYDPLRLVGAHRVGERHIRAHVRVHPLGREWSADMTVPETAPLAQLADPTGQGYMLKATFDLPPGCDEFEVWFSCTHADGHVDWDSEFGKNYWIRFPLHDLAYDLTAVVESEGKHDVSGELAIALTSVTAVDHVSVRWRAASLPGTPRSTTPLVCLSTDGDRKHWATPENVRTPRGATIVFDVVYRIGAHEYTDDNQGQWLVAEHRVASGPGETWLDKLAPIVDALASWTPIWSRWLQRRKGRETDASR